MDQEIIRDRLCDAIDFVIPEIVSATRVLLLQDGVSSLRAELVAKCEHYIRVELAETHDVVWAILARLDLNALDDGYLRLVAHGTEGQQVVACELLSEIAPLASDNWDCTIISDGPNSL